MYPLSSAAGHFAIEEMARTNAPVIAGRAGDRLTRGLQRLIDKHGLPYVAYNQGSIVHLESSGVMLLDMKNRDRTLQTKPRATLNITRAHAAQVIKEELGLDSFAGLVGGLTPDSWTDQARSAMYSNEGSPGRDRFAQALGVRM